MHVSECIGCRAFPCEDVKHEGYIVPDVEIQPDLVSLVMISEAAPESAGDYYYAAGDPLFQQTTVQAFNDAGVAVSSIRDILGLGVYLTTAVKCAKTGYGIKAATIKECSLLLEKELALFPNVKAYLLMGDVAIKALNYIAKRAGEPRVIPAGSTYKIRGKEYTFRGARAFPSYLQAGPSFFIEKSKRKMIAEDIAAAVGLIGASRPSAGASMPRNGGRIGMGYNWLVCDAIDEKARRAVGKGLVEYNASHSEPLRQRYYEPGGKPRPLDVYLLDAQGQVVGGLVGETLWHWLYLDDVWLEESLRGQGHGREMMRRAEEEARRRGCTKARLSTMSFQARGFYEKLGYRVVGELEDWPPGCSDYWMMKEL